MLEASSGQHALDLLERGVRPSVMVLDLRLPDVDGRDILTYMHDDGALREVPTVVVTRSEKGAFALSPDGQAEVPAQPIEALVDTTGAGDLFAAGFLAGVARELSLRESLQVGAICAAEVIQHYGARPEADLRALARESLA